MTFLVLAFSGMVVLEELISMLLQTPELPLPPLFSTTTLKLCALKSEKEHALPLPNSPLKSMETVASLSLETLELSISNSRAPSSPSRIKSSKSTFLMEINELLSEKSTSSKVKSSSALFLMSNATRVVSDSSTKTVLVETLKSEHAPESSEKTSTLNKSESVLPEESSTSTVIELEPVLSSRGASQLTYLSSSMKQKISDVLL